MGDETKCIAVASDTAADGTNIELQTYTGADNQLFKFVKQLIGIKSESAIFSEISPYIQNNRIVKRV